LENEKIVRLNEIKKNPHKQYHKEWINNIFSINNDYFICTSKLLINEKFDIIIPFGIRCSNALSLKKLNFRKLSLPFDYIHIKNVKNLFNCLNDDFKYFLNNKPNDPILNFYNMTMGILHLFPNFYINNHKNNLLLKKRVLRLNNILKSDKRICLLFSNEDYFYSPTNRDLNNENFEFLKKIHNLLKNKYPNLKFNIICIDGVEHNDYHNIKNIYVTLNNNHKLLNDPMVGDKTRTIYQNKFRSFLTLLIKKILKEPTNNLNY